MNVWERRWPKERVLTTTPPLLKMLIITFVIIRRPNLRKRHRLIDAPMTITENKRK